jgi:serine/threonine-protein kinase PknK
VHAAAVYDLNQATAHSERGRFGAALEATGSALAELARLGDVAELAAAWYNRGIALLALGEIAAAGRAAAAALRDARTPNMAIYATLLGGDVSRRQGDTAAARAAYERARDDARDHGCARELLMCSLNLAEILAQENDGRAAEILAQAADQAHSADDRDRLTHSRARVALLLGVDADGQPLEQAGALLGAVQESSRRALASGRLDQAWRGELLAARLCRARAASSDATEDAKRHLRQARALFEDMLADTPESHRDGLRGDPDACALAALAAELGLRPGPGATLDSGPMASVRSPDELRRLLALSRRLNSQLSLGPLLEEVIDAAIELTGGERGFLLLAGAEDALEVAVARNFDARDLQGRSTTPRARRAARSPSARRRPASR